MSQTIVLVADLFVDRAPQGGAEIVNDLLAKDLRQRGFKVIEVEAFRLDKAFFDNHTGCFYIVAGMLSLKPESINCLLGKDYVVYEHDHKYLNDRNPAKFPAFRAPDSQLRFQKIYENAKAVICQSQMHKDILHLNLPNCKQILSAGGSLWSEQFLSFVENSLRLDAHKSNKAAIMKTSNHIKGQLEAEQYCRNNNIEYDLVEAPDPKSLFAKLLDYEYFVFLPKTPETFSRVFMEAKLAGCKVVTNSLVGAAHEEYTFDDPKVLLEEVRNSRRKIRSLFEGFIPSEKPGNEISFLAKKPVVSIITSVFRGQEFIDGFMKDITSQSCFDQCELIMVDCNEENSGYEKEVIKEYQKKYSNIQYHYLEKDPGVYGAWNYAIKKSNGKYITNANLDDRRSYRMIEECYKVAVQNPDKDLIYPCFIVTNVPNETFYTTRSLQVFNTLEFSKQNMRFCPPGCMPLWKKSLHDINGMFDETYTSAGDLEFWLRCVKNGSEFIRHNVVLGLYYFNPEGLSTSSKNHERKVKEEQKVFHQYAEVFS